MKLLKILFLIAHVILYILGIIVIYQLMRFILGGSWSTEEIIISLVMSNLGVSFGTLGYVLHLSNSLNSKIANVDKKLHGHLEWHRARDR